MTFKAISVLALVALTACGAEPKWAPDEAVAKAHFVAEAPRSITLFTVVSTRSGSGAHSGLLINASEQVMFDPALDARSKAWLAAVAAALLLSPGVEPG